MDKYIGKTLGRRYQIVELIGIGGMANVYRAKDTATGEMTAVKIIKDEYLKNEEFLRRFNNEAKAIAGLSHPNIVRIIDVINEDGVPAIVMEYIDGITLKEYIEREKIIKWKEALHYTVQVLRGLQHAHDKGIVHRDIKPQNIMLLSDGTIKITDFGIARFARYDQKTLSDKVIGSVHYISPEQACGDVTDHRTDLYSVGVMLYEMITGTLPFNADAPVSVVMMQVSKEPRKPREINNTIPEGLEEIVLKAMAKNTAQRYQSAAEMLKDIDEFKANPSIQFEYKYFIDDSAHIAAESDSDKKNAENKDSEEVKLRKKSPLIPILSAIAAAFVLVFFIFIIIILKNAFGKGSVKDVEVPNLCGMTMLEAQNTYPNLKITKQTDEYSTEYAANYIMWQSVPQGKSIKETTEILVNISRGAKTVVVPDIAEMELTAAVASLQKSEVENFRQQEQYDDKIAKGYVIKTTPEAFAEIPITDTVTVFVSLGPVPEEAIKMPNTPGMQLSEAKEVLTSRGFKISKVTKQDSDKKADTVLSQSLTADESYDKNTEVELVVASGTKPPTQVDLTVYLPTVITDTVKLEATISDGTVVSSKEVKPDVAQTWTLSVKGSGTETLIIYIDNEKYQIISIDFDAGKYSVTEDYSGNFMADEGELPNVIGKYEEDAKTSLNSAGFTNITIQYEADDSEPGVVLRVSPDSGKVPYADEITIVVSSGLDDSGSSTASVSESPFGGNDETVLTENE